jgi:Fe-S oxidoreductase
MTSREKKILEATMGITLKEMLKGIKAVGFSGRCWGTGGSFYQGSHVTLGEGKEVVSAHIKNGKIQVMEYRKTTGTALGKKVRQILKAKNLPLAG